ncbi:putative pap 25a associated domain family protein [Blattamonas nauphoetae]|uniref:Pap 25a associated domain family protein n=1 Tax=Blattamonas nauphoetae TaxID=2049346 RepID=A0ABQ9XYZ0_9EUKA|nr:putative pap 25a associated domain family protein [Blattamonas nauphoetae]
MSSNIPVTDHTLSISPPKSENPPSPAEQERPQPSSDTTNAPTPSQNPNTTPKNIWFPKLQMVCPRGVEEEIDGFVGQREFVANNANFSKIEMIRVALEKFVVGVLPTASGVELFGSARSTTMTTDSDLDFTILFKSSPENSAESLGLLKDAMETDGVFMVKEYNPASRIPAIRCVTNMQIWDESPENTTSLISQINIELSLENRVGVAGCDLIKTYCGIDERVRPFLLLVKKWAKAKNISDARKMGLSRYTWNLISLCFLQLVSPPVIPNLQSEKYIEASDQSLVVDQPLEEGRVRFSTDCGPWKSQMSGLLPNRSDPLQSISPRPSNTQSLGSLFLNFTNFMANQFTSEMAFSLRHGGLVPTDSVQHLMKDAPKPPRFFTIIDPFHNNKNLGISAIKHGRVLQQFKETTNQILKQVPFHSIVPQTAPVLVGDVAPAQLVFIPSPSFKTVCPPKIETEIENFMKQPEFQKSEANDTKLEVIRSALEEIVKECLTSTAGVSLFGSARSSLMTPSSDLDFSITTPFPLTDPTTMLQVIEKKLNESGVFTVYKFNPGKRVQLLKCSTTLGSVGKDGNDGTKSESRTEFDLVLGHQLGIRHCDLIRAYCECDERVRPFLLLVKTFVKAKGIGGATKRSLSCFGWNIISLCYLQLVSPPVIPNLQSEEYIGVSEKSLVVEENFVEGRARFSTDCGPWKSQMSGLLPNRSDPLQSLSPRPSNTQSLGSLFVGFLDFMTNHFKQDIALSLQHGALLTSDSAKHFVKETNPPCPFVVIDPFEKARNTAASIQKTNTIVNPFIAALQFLGRDGVSFTDLVSSDQGLTKKQKKQADTQSDGNDVQPKNDEQPPALIPFPTLEFVWPQGIEEEINEFVKQPELQDNNADYAKFERIRSALEPFVKECIPTATEVTLFGSARSTLMSPGSDLDFSICTSEPVEDVTATLSSIKDKMREGGPFIALQFVPGLRVPVIKCITDIGSETEPDTDNTNSSEPPTEFDLIIGDRLGVITCDLVRTYCDLDDRIRPFLLLVKKWASAYGIRGAARMHLSSFAWNLTCINYLQQCSPPILPNIQSEAYISASNPSLVIDYTREDSHAHFSMDLEPWKSRKGGLLPNPNDPLQAASPRPLNTQSVGSLFLGLVDFLANHHTSEMAFAVKFGGIVATEAVRHNFRSSSMPAFVVLDPWDKKRNSAASVRKGTGVKQPFIAALKNVKKGYTFKKLITPNLQAGIERQRQQMAALTPSQAATNNITFLPLPQLVTECPPQSEDKINVFVRSLHFAANDTHFAKAELVRSALEQFVKSQFTFATGVELFGAARSSIISPNSSLDFMLTTTGKILSRKDLLDRVKHRMAEGEVFTPTRFIPDEKVPIIMCRTSMPVWDEREDGADNTEEDCVTFFDVFLERRVEIRSCDLIRAYCEMDERVRPFLLLVKTFAKTKGIASREKGELGSYGWNLASLCYLQLVSPPVIPNLQSEEYIEASDQSLVVDQPLEEGRARFSTDCGPWKSGLSGLLPNRSDPLQSISPRPSNTQSLGSLFVGFLDFMTNHFSKDTTLSLRHGALISTTSVIRPSPPFVILDPFELDRNAAALVKKSKELKKPCGDVLRKLTNPEEDSFLEIISGGNP